MLRPLKAAGEPRALGPMVGALTQYAGQSPARVLVVDPPWRFDDNLPGPARGAAKHYQTMPLDALKLFPLPPLLDDAVLFLWRVDAMEEEAFELLRAWGFKKKSSLIWRKTRACKICEGKGYYSSAAGLALYCTECRGAGKKLQMGMGRYTRKSTEICIIATRGSCLPDGAKDQLDIFAANRTKHSAKPDEFYEIVKRLYPKGPHVELFARKRREGWIQYGDELEAEASIEEGEHVEDDEAREDYSE